MKKYIYFPMTSYIEDMMKECEMKVQDKIKNGDKILVHILKDTIDEKNVKTTCISEKDHILKVYRIREEINNEILTDHTYLERIYLDRIEVIENKYIKDDSEFSPQLVRQEKYAF